MSWMCRDSVDNMNVYPYNPKILTMRYDRNGVDIPIDGGNRLIQGTLSKL